MKNARRVILSIFGLMLFTGCAKPLIEAARDGQIKLVEDLLNKGADINEKTLYNGQTALMYAVENGSIDVVRVLLNKGADINVKNNDGNTALRRAAEKGHLDIMKLLIEKGADVNTKDNNGWIPLIWAAENGRLDIVKTLIDKGADVNAKISYGKTALRIAAEKGHLDIMKLLIDKGADIGGDGLFRWAAEKGYPDIVKASIDKGADVNAKFSYFNNWYGSSDCDLFRDSPSADFYKHTYGSSSLCEVQGVTALMLAAGKGHFKIVQLLLENGAYLDEKIIKSRETPLFFAAYNGHTEIVRLLLAKGAEPGLKNPNGKTPLQLADEKGHTAIVKLLKKAEENWDAKLNQPSVPVENVEPALAPIIPLPADEKLPPIRKDAHALVIGIDYKGREGIPSLQYASQDAKKVYAALTDPRYGGVPKENATLLLNEKATRIEIMKALRRIKGMDGYVYLYYTGHGAPKTKGDKLEDGLLVPSDVDNSDSESLEESSIRMSYIQDILDTSPAKGVLVALDACFSGGGEKSIVAKGGKPLTLMPVSSELIKPKGTGKVIITSSATNQQSWEDDKELQGGIFSHYLLEGMKGKAGKDVWVNANELAEYIKVNVPKAVLNLKGADQNPQVIGHADFAVSRNWERSKVMDIEMAGAKLKVVFEKGAITTDQFNRAMDELKTPNRSKTLESFLEGKIDEKKFGTVY